MTFLNKFLNLGISRLSFSFIFLLIAFILIIFFPDLRTMSIAYAVMLLLAEGYKSGIQADRTPFLKGMVLFGVSVVVFTMVFSFVPSTLINKDYLPIESVGLIGWILYFLLVASVEEDVFRGILPRVTGSIFWVQVSYVIFHVASIYMLVGSFNIVSMLPYLLFTFLFAFVACFLTHVFKTTEPAKGLHFVFDLFKKGLLMSVLGGVL